MTAARTDQRLTDFETYARQYAVGSEVSPTFLLANAGLDVAAWLREALKDTARLDYLETFYRNATSTPATRAALDEEMAAQAEQDAAR